MGVFVKKKKKKKKKERKKEIGLGWYPGLIEVKNDWVDTQAYFKVYCVNSVVDAKYMPAKVVFFFWKVKDFLPEK